MTYCCYWHQNMRNSAFFYLLANLLGHFEVLQTTGSGCKESTQTSKHSVASNEYARGQNLTHYVNIAIQWDSPLIKAPIHCFIHVVSHQYISQSIMGVELGIISVLS